MQNNFFGVKQNTVLKYADNLAWFGKDSYVYRNNDLMLEVIKNPIAMSNPVTALYGYMWARENGYRAIDLFNQGLKINVYNEDLDRSFEFVLGTFNDDGSATFLTTTSFMALPVSTANVGTEVLDYGDYDIVNYLNGEKNWYEKWENKPASIGKGATLGGKGYTKLKTLNGFKYGFDNAIKDRLLPFDDEGKFVCLPLEYTDINEYINTNYVTKRKYNTVTSDIYDLTMFIQDSDISDANFRLNNTNFWHILIKKVESAEELGSSTLKRGGIVTGVAHESASSSNSIPAITNMALFGIKIKM